MASSLDPEKSELDATVSRYESAMSSQSEDPHAELPLKQAIRQYSTLVYYILGLSTVIILWGYDLVVVGSVTSLEPFQRDFGVFDKFEDGKEKWIIPAMWLSLWQAFPSIGQLFAAISSGPLQDRLGRKPCLLIGSFVTVFSVLVEFMAYKAHTLEGKRGVFLAGKIIQGYALALVKMQTLTWVSEIVPTCLRGASMALFPTFNVLGQFLGSVVVFGVNGVETKTGYLIAFGVQWVFGICPIIMAFVLPESPAYLIRKKDMEGARSSLTQLFAPKNDAEALFEKFRISIEEEERISKELSYAQCFKGTNRRRSLIIIFANLLPPLFGLPLLTSTSYFLQQLGMESKWSLLMLIIGIVIAFFANLGSTWALSHIQRRRLTIWTLLIAAVLWCAMGITGCVPNGKGTPWITGAFMLLVIFICGLGVWPASYAIMSESSALRLRAKSQAIGGISAYIAAIFTNFVLPYLYNPDAADLKAKTGFVFMACSVVGAAGTWLLVPEMKGRSPIEIDHLFEAKVGARQSEGWKDTRVEARTADL